MANVIVDKSKIDLLANAIADKSGEALTMTLDEMVSAVDGIETGGGGITPTGNIDITSAGVTDVTNYATATVASGTEGTPTINVGSLWRGERMVTASVTNTEGYISGGTHNANGIILSASDFATGSYTITENDTYDVTDTAEVVVQVEPSLQSKTNISPTTSSQTIEADSGYDGLSSVQINAMPSGTEGTPTATKGTVSNHAVTVTPSVTNSAGYISGGTHNGTAVSVSASELVSGTYTVSSSGTADVTNYASISVPSGSASAPSTISGTSASVSTGTNTLTLSKTVSVTPTVSAGYVSSGTATNSSVSLTANVTTKGATNHYATTSDQTIASGTYLTGNQTIKALSQTNLSADNIKNGTTITISNGNANVWSVTGTYGGGGTSKNTQVVQGTTRTTSSSMTAIGAELTVSKTGTYDVYWSAFRSNTSTTYTYATQLYVGGSAYGSENSTWSNHVQNNHLTNVSLTQNQKIRVYGRNSRGSSYYIYAPTLVIVEA